MSVIIQIALGGAIGAVARYLVGLAVVFPFGTMAVNVLGSFLMGCAFIALTERAYAPFVMIGLLGGFTTFSAFSLDVFKLLEVGRSVAAGGYVLVSVLGSVLALIAGVAVARALS